MSMTATIAISASSVYVNQPINCTLTISNSGASAVNVTSVMPTAILTGATQPNPPGCALGVVPLGPGETIAVGASGTLALPFSAIFFAPSTGYADTGTGTYSIGAVCQTSDGSIFSPTAATATVHPIDLGQ